jgi:formylmethanofuran dehydrogenase subunit E
MTARTLAELLEESSRSHRHLCPRQVLGVRMGMLAARVLGLELPQSDKRLLTIVESDGCVIDGIIAATGCTVGHRTLRVEDYGKIAATFVDTATGRAVRFVPRKEIREAARAFAPSGYSKWEAQLYGYQTMEDDDLFAAQEVELVVPVERIVSTKGKKAVCERCGEEVNNEREVHSAGAILCKPCAQGGYYRPKARHDDAAALDETTHEETADH